MSANGYTKEQVIEALHDIAGEMHNKMLKGEPPTMTLPVRTKKNIAFDPKLGVYKYGKKRSTRDATSLGSARQLLRALHVTEFIEEMIHAGKSSTLREMYYISEGWGHGKFGSQNESNNLAEDLEIITKCMREDFKLRPEEDGARIIGNITFEERNRRGDWMRINCRDDVGDSGYGVPYNVEAEKLRLIEHDVDFIMAIETGGMFDRLIENGFDEAARCALIHLKGQPARSTRRIIKRMNEEWNLMGPSRPRTFRNILQLQVRFILESLPMTYLHMICLLMICQARIYKHLTPNYRTLDLLINGGNAKSMTCSSSGRKLSNNRSRSTA
jgi:DNA topoisomerase-6 subunit A